MGSLKGIKYFNISLRLFCKQQHFPVYYFGCSAVAIRLRRPTDDPLPPEPKNCLESILDRRGNSKHQLFAIFCSLFYRSLALLIFILATYFSTVLARRVSKLNELPVIFSLVSIEGGRILQQFA